MLRHVCGQRRFHLRSASEFRTGAMCDNDPRDFCANPRYVCRLRWCPPVLRSDCASLSDCMYCTWLATDTPCKSRRGRMYTLKGRLGHPAPFTEFRCQPDVFNTEHNGICPSSQMRATPRSCITCPCATLTELSIQAAESRSTVWV